MELNRVVNMKKEKSDVGMRSANEPTIFEIFGMIAAGIIIIEIGLSIF